MVELSAGWPIVAGVSDGIVTKRRAPSKRSRRRATKASAATKFTRKSLQRPAYPKMLERAYPAAAK